MPTEFIGVYTCRKHLEDENVTLNEAVKVFGETFSGSESVTYDNTIFFYQTL